MYCMVFVADCLQVYMSYNIPIESERENKANSCSNETVSGDQKNFTEFSPTFLLRGSFPAKNIS